MKLLMFAVYDKAVKAYMPPFYSRAKGEAVRSFIEACNDEKSNFSKHAADFHLSYLGEFDDATGLVDRVDPERVITALECLADNIEPFRKDNKLAL